MRLFYSSTSPYARKVRVLIIEKGLTEHVELVAVNPLGEADELCRQNPLGKVPVLLLDDGRVLYDSPVICEYLDWIGHGPRLLTSDPASRFDILTRQALADGIMDAAFALVMEYRRAPPQQSTEWIARWTAAISRAIAAAEQAVSEDRPIDLGELALTVALAYLDFRLPQLNWSASAPALVGHHARMLARNSLVQTGPVVMQEQRRSPA